MSSPDHTQRPGDNAGSSNPDHDSANPTGRDLAQDIVRKLRKAGFTAYLAGGCVRDEVMGLVPNDFDVATDATPDKVRRMFRNTRAVGEHFGVVLVRDRGAVVEVATFRKDAQYSDRRRPDAVAFTDARTDAQRRDFTINGLFKDPITDEVVDFVNGQADIKAKVIRAIGDPDQRLSEDHLRALRAVRFAARFGFAIEPATAQAIKRHAAELQGVSRERIGTEIRALLEHPSRSQAIRTLQELSLDGPVLNEPTQQSSPSVLAALDLPDTATRDEIVVASLAAWALDRQSADARLPSRWRKALILSNLETQGLKSVLSICDALADDWPTLPVAQRKRLAARSWFNVALSVFSARHPDSARRITQQRDTLAAQPGGLEPAPLLTGDDLVEMGWKPGPGFQQTLDHVYDAQLEARITTPQQARALAKNLRKNA